MHARRKQTLIEIVYENDSNSIRFRFVPLSENSMCCVWLFLSVSDRVTTIRTPRRNLQFLQPHTERGGIYKYFIKT